MLGQLQMACSENANGLAGVPAHLTTPNARNLEGKQNAVLFAVLFFVVDAKFRGSDSKISTSIISASSSS